MRILWPTLLLLVACGAAPGADRSADPCSPDGPPTLRIGGSDRGFLHLEDGEPIELVHGPQGRYHIEIGLEATHLDTSDRQRGRMEVTADGEVLATAAPYLDLRCNDPAGAQHAWGTLLVFDATPDLLHDRTATVTAEVTDAADNLVADTLSVVIVDPTFH